MAEMIDVILKDVARVIERHPDLTPASKTRLLLGLAERDRELADINRAVAFAALMPHEPDEPVPTAKRGRR